MGDRMQGVKGKANEVTGKDKTEAKGQGRVIKGKTQQAAGHAKSAVKKVTD